MPPKFHILRSRIEEETRGILGPQLLSLLPPVPLNGLHVVCSVSIAMLLWWEACSAVTDVAIRWTPFLTVITVVR